MVQDLWTMPPFLDSYSRRFVQHDLSFRPPFEKALLFNYKNAGCNKTQALKIRTEAAASYQTLRERSFVRIQLMAFQQSNRLANRYVNPVRPVCQFIPDLIEGFFV